MTSHVGLITVLLLTIWTLVAGSSLEHDRCPDRDFLPSSCQLPENCHTLDKYFEDELLTPSQVPRCGFKTAFASMMYCCPDQPPAIRPINPTVINFRPSHALIPTGFVSTHLATLEYLEPVNRDDYVYHCTGIVLSSTFVLATSKCVGNDIIYKPNKVILGVSDPTLGTQIEIEIKESTFFKNDLVLFELEEEITQSQLGVNVTLAQRCNNNDLLGVPNLFAVGFAHDQEKNTNCGLFRQSLRKVSFWNCRNVPNNRQVQAKANAHLCAVPGEIMFDSSQTDNCSKCLTGSSSVLHIQRRNGSTCVVGIATPTTDECIVNGSPLLYTSITNFEVNEFFNKANVF